MEFLGKNDDKMINVKFLHSAVSDLSSKENVTVTDYLALKAFVVSERLDCKNYADMLEEGSTKVSKDMRAYIELLDRVIADLSYTGAGLESAIFSAQSTTSWSFHHWGLDKE